MKGNGTQRERKRNNLLERKQYSSEKNSSTNNTRMKRTLIIIAAIMTAMTPLKAQNTTAEHNLEVAKQLETFSTLYNYLDMMYVDTLNAEKVIGKGINSMLASLDPYTEYYPESETKKLKRMMTGKYGGIGFQLLCLALGRNCFAHISILGIFYLVLVMSHSFHIQL